MQILKQNLFLVIVGAVLLVGASVLLAMKYQKDDQEKQMMLERDKVNEDIHRIPTGGFIQLNEKPGELPVQIKELKVRLDELKDQDDKVKAECCNWNFRNYKVLQLRGEEKPAFPEIDRVKNAGYLVLLFKDTYREELGKLEASMSPVKPVTQEELNDKTNVYRIKLQQEAALDWAKYKKEHPSTQPASKPAGGSSGAVSGGEETAPVTDFSAPAREEAIKALRLRQANQGKIYISSGAMHSFFGSSREPSATAAELWQAQLNLWVQGDIVQAISDANEYSAKLVRAKQASVLTSAVKRLLRIGVDKDYYLGANAGGAAASGETAAPAGGTTGGHSLTDTAAPAAPTGGTTEGDLTQHYSNKDFDVIQYEFTVVRPARHIPTLESCLMQRNFHTILKVDIGPLSAAATSAVGKAAMIPPYYGPDAVMEVTFKGELLLLTSWERGKYNSTDKKWDLPPLMPKDVLDGLKSVQRPQDVDYLSGKITYPAGATSTQKANP